MRGYSEDLRERVVAAVERGTKRSAVVEAFMVSRATIKRWAKQWRDQGDLAMKPVPGRPAVTTRGLAAALPERLASQADATLEEHCSWWQEVSGHEVSLSTMSRALTRSDWTRKKTRTANLA
jgi:transposase